MFNDSLRSKNFQRQDSFDTVHSRTRIVVYRKLVWHQGQLRRRHWQNYHGEPLLQHLRKLAPITVLRSATIGPYPYLPDLRGTPNAKLNINSSKGRIVSIWG